MKGHEIRINCLGLIANNKAIVLCAHLHRYSVVKRETNQGPVVQVMVNSVIRDSNHPEPYSFSKEYGPQLVDAEPQHAPANCGIAQRSVLSREAKYVTDFRIADLPGLAVLTIAGDKINLKVYRGTTDTIQEELDLSAMLNQKQDKAVDYPLTTYPPFG